MAALSLQPVTLNPDPPLPRTSTITRRVLSFGRRSKKEAERPDSSGPRRRSSISAAAGRGVNVVRTLSFGRVRREAPREHQHIHASIREITLFRASVDDVIGLALTKPTLSGISAEGEGILISSVKPGGIAAKSKRIQAGDLLCAVNGVKVLDYKHAAELLRAARGVIQLVIAASTGLPDGWKAHTDAKGVAYFTHQAYGIKSYDHPAALFVTKKPSGDEPGDSKKLCDPRTRWHAVYHTVTLINSLAGETEKHDKSCEEDMCDHYALGKGQMLQHERV